MVYETEADSNCTWYIWNSLQKPEKEGWRTGDQRKNLEYKNQSPAKIRILRRICET